MLELASRLLAAIDAGSRVAVATVVAVDGSAPRALGTSMAVDSSGAVIGSISGGCVEGAVYDACTRVLESGRSELCEFGFSDDDAFAVGLACGGRLSVVVHEFAAPGLRNALRPATRRELEAAAEGREASLGLVVDDEGGRILSSDTPHEDPRLLREVEAAGANGVTRRRAVECDGEVVQLLLLASAPPPRMIVFGAVDFSAALASAAALLGYRVTVCDARPVFATAARFPQAEVVNRWPSDYLADTEVDERTVLCVMTHDDKFDVPLLTLALRLPVAYVGAMGSRRTHERRLERLREAGLDDSELAALHSPIGLDLGASSPEETAVSILAEVLQSRTRASAAPLRETSGPIHRPATGHGGHSADLPDAGSTEIRGRVG
ncbi:XdhC family protein [Cnuibacter sp. UC19_7]|uniref:XdhC family protein n=1 Tax=Cnuibacter sp. UC19_7 TaxID=3350166 RepID=UPI00366B5DF1